MCLSASRVSSGRNIFRSAHFSIRFFSYMASLYIWDTNPLYVWFSSTRSHSGGCVCIFGGFLCCAEAFSFDVVPLVCFCFCCFW